MASGLEAEGRRAIARKFDFRQFHGILPQDLARIQGRRRLRSYAQRQGRQPEHEGQ
jgi:hypothetical protein